MFVTSATPKEIHHWFHHGDHSQRALCFLLSRTNDDSTRLRELISELNATDLALGDHIAFIVFHPDADLSVALEIDGTERKVIKGVLATIGISPLRKTRLFQDVTDELHQKQSQFSREASRATANSAFELIQFLGISNHELPAICILTKGCSEIVIKGLDSNWHPANLQDFFSKLQKFISQLEFGDNPRKQVIESKDINEIRDTLCAIENRKNRIDDALQQLAQKCPLSTDESRRLQAFFENDDRSTNSVKQLFQNAPSLEPQDQRTQKIYRLAGQYEEYIKKLQDRCVPDHYISEQQRAQYARQNQLEILRFAKSLENTNIRPIETSLMSSAATRWEILQRANALIDIMGKGWIVIRSLIS